MKHSLFLVFAFAFLHSQAQLFSKTKNVFVVTIDGIRWQEVFKGADPNIINSHRYTSDIELAKLMYVDSSSGENRKKLMPFFGM